MTCQKNESWVKMLIKKTQTKKRFLNRNILTDTLTFLFCKLKGFFDKIFWLFSMLNFVLSFNWLCMWAKHPLHVSYFSVYFLLACLVTSFLLSLFLLFSFCTSVSLYRFLSMFSIFLSSELLGQAKDDKKWNH